MFIFNVLYTLVLLNRYDNNHSGNGYVDLYSKVISEYSSRSCFRYKMKNYKDSLIYALTDLNCCNFELNNAGNIDNLRITAIGQHWISAIIVKCFRSIFVPIIISIITTLTLLFVKGLIS